MKTNITAKVVLFPQQTKKGFPIKIRITENSKHTYIGLKYYLTESQRSKYWNEKKGELKKHYANFEKVMNEFDSEIKRRGIKLKQPIESNQGPIQSNFSFSLYYKNYMRELEVKSQFGLLQKANSVFIHLERFCKETQRPNDIQFNDLNIDFIKAFQIYLIENKLLPITQKGYFEKIRSIVNQAIEEGKFNPIRHPFLGFKFLPADNKPKCLEPQQFYFLKNMVMGKTRSKIKIYDTINKKELPPLSRNHINTGLIFLFQYFTFGMRVSDLLQLKYENIYESGKRIKYVMFKTKNSMDIVLGNDLLDILFEFLDLNTQNKIIVKCKQVNGEHKFLIGDTEISYSRKNEFYDLVRTNLYLLSQDKELKSNHIFPLIPNHLELDKKMLFSKISTYTAVYNKSLKALSKELEKYSSQDLNLSSHMARHTFAYLSMIGGQSVYYISQALNHKSVKTTENYLLGFNKRQLDNVFYKSQDLSVNEKKYIDDKLREFIASSDYAKKKKFIDFFNL